MKKSTHQVEVVPIELLPHENADKLSVVKIHDTYTCVVNTESWEGVSKAAWIPPETLVPVSREEFSFLDKNDGEEFGLIKSKKLRGIMSYGMLIPVPDEANIGDDMSDYFGTKHYEPPENTNLGGDNVSVAGTGLEALSKYDIDAFGKYNSVFNESEMVMVTEKIHGANARFACRNGQMYCGSKRFWLAENSQNTWWAGLKNHPEVEEFCRNNENYVVWGEVYGPVQNMKYGSDRVKIAVFDIFDLEAGKFLDAAEALEVGADLPWVPLIGVVEFDVDKLIHMASGPSFVESADHFREGIVVKPMNERWDKTVGRVILKIVSEEYLSGKPGQDKFSKGRLKNLLEVDFESAYSEISAKLGWLPDIKNKKERENVETGWNALKEYIISTLNIK